MQKVIDAIGAIEKQIEGVDASYDAVF